LNVQDRLKPIHQLIIGICGVIYVVLTMMQWGEGYVDFGDGNYMYISSRMAEGVELYSEILAPQPPCHPYLGMCIAKIATTTGKSGPDVIIFFRLAGMLIHLISWMLIMRLAWLAWRDPVSVILAGLIYLVLPLGYWWSFCWESEPLEMLFLLSMMVCSLSGRPGHDILTGIFAALAGLTNATAAPFLLVLIIYMMIKAPRRALMMTVPCVLLVAIITIIFQVKTGGEYWQNVISNQAATFYPPDVALGKIIGQGQKILYREGFFLFIALIGFARFLRAGHLNPVSTGGLAWFCLATLLSIVYVSKAGTVDYIFTLSEPAIAILASGELATWIKRLRSGPVSPNNLFLKISACVLLFCFAMGPVIVFFISFARQQQYELPESRLSPVRYQIHVNSGEDDAILASPFYALVSNRRIYGEYSEIFLWTTSYLNDRFTSRHDGPGWTKAMELSLAIERAEIPIVILELEQTGRIPEIMMALKKKYRPIRPEGKDFLFRTLNIHLAFFIPDDSELRLPADGIPSAGEWSRFEEEVSRNFGDRPLPFLINWLGKQSVQAATGLQEGGQPGR
jgi:hypothetical protein